MGLGFRGFQKSENEKVGKAEKLVIGLGTVQNLPRQMEDSDDFLNLMPIGGQRGVNFSKSLHWFTLVYT